MKYHVQKGMNTIILKDTKEGGHKFDTTEAAESNVNNVVLADDVQTSSPNQEREIFERSHWRCKENQWCRRKTI